MINKNYYNIILYFNGMKNKMRDVLKLTIT